MITSNEMREIEEHAEQTGVSRLELMENAGRAVASFIEEKFGDELSSKKILVVCGSGNNGGDGFVTARLLHDVSKVDVLFLGEIEKMSFETRTNYDSYRSLKERKLISYRKHGLHVVNFSGYDIIIDAMTGYGLKGEIEAPYSHAANAINATKAYVVCVDIPSGLEADDDKFDEERVHVDPDIIITFHDTKPALKKFGKKVKIVPIGIRF